MIGYATTLSVPPLTLGVVVLEALESVALSISLPRQAYAFNHQAGPPHRLAQAAQNPHIVQHMAVTRGKLMLSARPRGKLMLSDFTIGHGVSPESPQPSTLKGMHQP